MGAFGGKKEIMEFVAPLGSVYQAGTLSANPLAISAGIAILKELLKPGFYEELESKTQSLCKLIDEHARKNNYELHMQSIASIFWFTFSYKRAQCADDIQADKMSIFRQLHKLLLEKGIYLGPSGYEVGFVSAAHSMEDIEWAAHTINGCLDEIMA